MSSHINLIEAFTGLLKNEIKGISGFLEASGKIEGMLKRNRNNWKNYWGLLTYPISGITSITAN